jgi:bifunctional UDP-N-acetylglucosamine pyrophosphorylase/glucosamine-1-phosphate N-acetyltransferase
MQTVLLAAGDGEDIAALSASTPKPLLPVAGDPLLVHVARRAVTAGASSLVVVVPPSPRPFVDVLGSTFEDVPVVYAVQPRPTGTAKALAFAERNLDDDFVLLPGDTLYDPVDLGALYESVPCVCVTKRSARSNAPVLVGDGGPLDVAALADDEAGTYVDTGACSLPARATDWTRVPWNDDGERDVVGVVERTAEECEVRPVVVERHVDVDRPRDLLTATESVLEAWAGTVGGPVVGGHVSDRARLHGPVCVERGAVVEAGAVIEGPAFVDEGATVGSNARIAPSTYLGEDASVGHSALVERSVVLSNASIGHSSTVTDSVLGRDVEFGALTTVGTLKPANNRSDPVMLESEGERPFGVVAGEGARTGVHTSLHAGVTLGRRSTTDPGETVLTDR